MADEVVEPKGFGVLVSCAPIPVKNSYAQSSIVDERLMFLDESGMNVRMSRGHAWVKRGEELVDRIPMNWAEPDLARCDSSVRLVVLTSVFATANKDRFVRWLRAKLLPKLRRGDVLIMDHLGAHHDPRVRPACAARGVRVIYLPPYSPYYNPIESGWALQ